MSGRTRAVEPERAAATGRAVRVGLAVLAAVGVVAAVWPAALGLAGTAPFAQAVALRVPTSIGLLGLAVVLVAFPWRRRAVPAATVLVVGAVVGLAVVADRGLGAPAPDPADRPDDAVVVLVLNTQGTLGGADIAQLVVERQADLVVLPETWASVGEDVVAVTAAEGLPMQVLADDGAGLTATGATTLLVAERLGAYDVVATHGGELSSFTAAPRSGDGPTISAVHPYPPLPGAMGGWRDEGAAAVALCEEGASDVVAGDLNTTLDHPALRGLDRCVDAAVEAGAGGVGTWPVGIPALLGSPIDHVLADGVRWRVTSATVLEPPAGTDHRALEAVLVGAGRP